MLLTMVERELERQRPDQYAQLKADGKLSGVIEAQTKKAWNTLRESKQQGLGIETVLQRTYANLMPGEIP
jgi:hypothetical protein